MWFQCWVMRIRAAVPPPMSGSNRRAQAVINYLKQSSQLLPGRVLSASAMGEMNIPAESADSASHTQARRVTVRVLTSAAHLQH